MNEQETGRGTRRRAFESAVDVFRHESGRPCNPSMPRHIPSPTRIAAAGDPPKQIEEFVGRVNSHTDAVRVFAGRSEPRLVRERVQLSVAASVLMSEQSIFRGNATS